MHTIYKDVRSRIAEAPKWYDQNGVPRYDDFIPRMCPNIYANQVFLLRIACQHCGERFTVEMHNDIFNCVKHPKHLHYGDPPAHGCVGDTMNCEDLAILQVWTREGASDWERRPNLEGFIDEELVE